PPGPRSARPGAVLATTAGAAPRRGTPLLRRSRPSSSTADHLSATVSHPGHAPPRQPVGTDPAGGERAGPRHGRYRYPLRERTDPNGRIAGDLLGPPGAGTRTRRRHRGIPGHRPPAAAARHSGAG